VVTTPAKQKRTILTDDEAIAMASWRAQAQKSDRWSLSVGGARGPHFWEVVVSVQVVGMQSM
jgi:hypothetical protein